MYAPRSPINTTINELVTRPIKGTGSGSHSITIEKDGTLGNTGNIYEIINISAGNSDTPTVNLSNKGTINGQVYVVPEPHSSGTITVNTFENTGQINGIISMGSSISQGTFNIDNFINSGTVQSDVTTVVDISNAKIKTFTNNGLIHGLKNYDSLRIEESTVENFNNSGTIASNANGIYISNSTIKNFTNSGTIQSNQSNGIYQAGGAMENFTNSGTILGSLGIRFAGSTVKSITNTNQGLISGAVGVALDKANIENFTNKGTIESTSSDKKNAAIIVGLYKFASTSTINNFTNEGTITSKSNGIMVSSGSKIETLVNKGSIKADLDGISLTNYNRMPDSKIDLGSIILENGSSIQAGNNGINIEHTNSRPIVVGGIEVKQGAVVNGGNAGIYIGDGKEINTQITISGEVSGGVAGIVNEGIIGSSDDKKGGIIISGGSVSSSNGGSGIVNQGNGSINGEIKVENGGSVGGGITNTDNGSISGNIVVENGGKLDSITNTSTSDTGISGSITNNSDNKLEISNGESATIGGGITNNGGGTITIDNQGTINKGDNGNHVTNNGNGSIIIEDWVVSTDKDTGKLDTVVVGGSNTDNVKVDNITVDQGNADLDGIGDINDIISGVKPDNIGNIGTNGSGEIDLIYDPITGKVHKRFDLSASISGATFRSLISTTSRRSTFIDNVMGNSMQSFALASSSKSQNIAMSEKGNLYADASDYIKSDLNNGSYGSNKEHSLFILPYASSQNVELSLNEESKGHTKGTIIGYSTLKDSG
ncbi:TPA: beta strand repeat-containing protein, partial [Campylobacter jejuni]